MGSKRVETTITSSNAREAEDTQDLSGIDLALPFTPSLTILA